MECVKNRQVLAALNTGMRNGEILSLRRENVNLERNFITVTAMEEKSKRIRRIPINSELRKWFVRLKPAQNGNRYFLLILQESVQKNKNLR
jgi:integrase